jgi:hypothetical protein
MTIEGIDERLQVADIAAFPLLSYSTNVAVKDLHSSQRLTAIDHVAVTRGKGGPVIGVLDLRAYRDGRVGDHARPLTDEVLVAADAPLFDYVRTAAQHPFRLVLTKDGIRGAVTPSDLNKLPVRVLAFEVVAALEQALVRLLLRAGVDDANVERVLRPDETSDVRDLQDKLARDGLDLDLVDCTDFGQKMRLADSAKALEPGEYQQLDRIRHALRNRVAHGQPLVEAAGEVGGLADRLTEARRLTQRFDAVAA